MTAGSRPMARRIRRAPERVRRRVRGAPQPEWSRTRPVVVVRARRFARLLRRRWRRSMRLRVVATTMALGLVVVVALGYFLLARIRDGLVDAREASVMVESERLATEAQNLLTAAKIGNDTDGEKAVSDTLSKV